MSYVSYEQDEISMESNEKKRILDSKDVKFALCTKKCDKFCLIFYALLGIEKAALNFNFILFEYNFF